MSFVCMDSPERTSLALLNITNSELMLWSKAAPTGVMWPRVAKYTPTTMNPKPMERFWFIRTRVLRASPIRNGMRLKSLFIRATDAL